MSTKKQVRGVLHHFRRILQGTCAGMTDGELLEAYIAQCDEAPFEALIQRHGPMVWGVCRRLLHNYQDAEDAFQAVFLVFLRKARSIRQRELIGNWLYGVAHRTAIDARTTAAKRHQRESHVLEFPEPAVHPPLPLGDELRLLD